MEMSARRLAVIYLTEFAWVLAGDESSDVSRGWLPRHWTGVVWVGFPSFMLTTWILPITGTDENLGNILYLRKCGELIGYDL